MEGVWGSKTFQRGNYWEVLLETAEKLSDPAFNSFTFLKLPPVLFFLRLCLGPCPNQKFTEMADRMKASTYMHHFKYCSNEPRPEAGMQNSS